MAKILVDVVKIGAKGGRARAAKLSVDELKESGQKAAKARWDAYYEAHPEKLAAKLERQKKAKAKK